MANGNGVGKIMVAFLAGGVAGALSGLLLAPKSGAETRKKIRQTCTDTGDKAKEKLEGAKSGIADLFSRGKEKVDDVKTEIQDKIQDTVEAGREIYQKKKKELSEA